MMTQTQFDYDCFGWNPVRGLPASESYGLDYESAREATPRWFGVSFGNGNDGVSHVWPDYYCRTADPWLLARVAVIASFKPEFYDWARVEMTVDGESDYTITAAILDPPSDGTEDEEEDCGSWSDGNGAWLLCEVFPIDDIEEESSSAPRHDSLAECFDDDVLALARED